MIPLLEVLFIRPALFVVREPRRCEGRGDTFDFSVGMRSSFNWCRLHLNYKPRCLTRPEEESFDIEFWD